VVGKDDNIDEDNSEHQNRSSLSESMSDIELFVENEHGQGEEKSSEKGDCNDNKAQNNQNQEHRTPNEGEQKLDEVQMKEETVTANTKEETTTKRQRTRKRQVKQQTQHQQNGENEINEMDIEKQTNVQKKMQTTRRPVRKAAIRGRRKIITSDEEDSEQE
jgi:hypothetical protein